MEIKKIHTCYSSNTDITFIIEEVFKNNEPVSMEVKGFYFGEPNEEKTKQFYGDLKAEFDWT